jgi:hypothetical protein
VPEHCCKRPCACSTAASHSCQQETTRCVASVDAAAITSAHSTAAQLQALLLPLLLLLLPPLLLLLLPPLLLLILL